MAIRLVRKEDNPYLAKMIRSVFDELKAPTKGTVYEDPTTDQLFELFLEKKSALYVLTHQEEVAGCCGIFPTEGLEEGAVELVKFYIHSKCRSKGFGKALYAACEAEAIRLGYSKIYLETLSSFGTAIKLYESLGFKKLESPLGNSGHFGCDNWFIKELKKVLPLD